MWLKSIVWHLHTIYTLISLGTISFVYNRFFRKYFSFPKLNEMLFWFFGFTIYFVFSSYFSWSEHELEIQDKNKEIARIEIKAEKLENNNVQLSNQLEERNNFVQSLTATNQGLLIKRRQKSPRIVSKSKDKPDVYVLKTEMKTKGGLYELVNILENSGAIGAFVKTRLVINLDNHAETDIHHSIFLPPHNTKIITTYFNEQNYLSIIHGTKQLEVDIYLDYVANDDDKTKYPTVIERRAFVPKMNSFNVAQK
ncbi:MAG: hypothetical protein HY200_05150 [Nitrospirae bacterium]|nr:hypothetical protein [Nitrospirota bacterium]MBI3594326.1 hypothetical protein [Nitrospirota bacterium]